jgi:hypothetical protein
MFDKSDRISMYSNALVVIYGIFLALVGFVITGLSLVISALLLSHILYRLNLTAFTISSLERILTIGDANGANATEVQSQTITVNNSGQTEFWCKNIQSEGTVSNIRINGQSPSEQKQEDGNTQASIKFDSALKTGTTFDLALSYNHGNAFSKAQQTLVHVVDNGTSRLHLVVELPKGRPISSARVFCQHDGKDEQLLPPIISGQDRIEVVITEPELGAMYCLQWDWHKESIVDKLDSFFK